MRIVFNGTQTPRFWIGPALLGIMLICAGVLIWLFPLLLSFVVASFFIVAGFVLLSIAVAFRRPVTYRSLDERSVFRVEEEH